MGNGADSNRTKEKAWPDSKKQKGEEDMTLWGIFGFGLIAATAATVAARRLGRTIDFVIFQLTRAQSSAKGSYGKSFRTSFQENARRRYQKRMQEEYEEEMERVERIRRMQSVFHRERSKHQRKYQNWRENESGAYTQNFQREDWYWTTNNSYKDHRRTNFREAPRANSPYLLSHHYAVLGLDRARSEPYTESEIKKAFRLKAMQFHPDQNQGNKEAAEAKFKEVMVSYEAIKMERKNM